MLGQIKTKIIFVVCLAFLLVTTFPIIAVSLHAQFTTQAPFSNWNEPRQNACEETSIVIVDAYYNKENLTRESAEQKILQIINIKEKYYGKSLDENAELITELINKFKNWEAVIVANPSIAQIENEIDNSRPIIIPTYGRGLKNPNFLNGGSSYHVIVITGYDKTTNEFITQEPGTRFGENYRYSYSIIMSALHDYLPNDQTINGPKVAIFTSPQIIDSGQTDGDEDGLIKSLELAYGTSLISNDTDSDGYLDKEEIDNKYSPIVAEAKITSGSLLRTKQSGKVYLLNEEKIQHITNPEVFNKHHWQWQNIINVSEKFLNKFSIGPEINN